MEASLAVNVEKGSVLLSGCCMQRRSPRHCTKCVCRTRVTGMETIVPVIWRESVRQEGGTPATVREFTQCEELGRRSWID